MGKKERDSAKQGGIEQNGTKTEGGTYRSLYAEIIPYLLQWYDYNRRILPWREEPTPYHVWVSEIMLQQTRVEAVKGYYDRFLTCLPDVRSLAEAEEEVLLKLWEGLGYYNRVRNMQKAAKILAEQYGGVLPADYEVIRSLPGIGDYTAGAISSIAFGLPYPAVDGNVLRVMSRITCSEEDIAKEQTKQKLKEDLTKVFLTQKSDASREKQRQRSSGQGHQPTGAIGDERSNLYGDFNQSLMELGATVCLPNGKPLCEQCPVMHLCKAFHAGRESELPVKSGIKARRIEKRRVYVLSCEGKILLHRREKKGLLAGLWEFPNVLVEESGKKKEEQVALAARDLEQLGLAELISDGSMTIQKTKKAKHIFSHVEWHMEGIWLEIAKGKEAVRLLPATCHTGKGQAGAGKQAEERTEPPTEWVFSTVAEMQERYAIPSAFEAFVKEIIKGHVSESEEEESN